jgi:protein-glutamine gamma-glutamyltransferase
VTGASPTASGRGAAIAAGLLYALALGLYLLPLSSWVGVASAVVAGWISLRAAAVARQRQLRLAVAIGLGLAVAVVGILLGGRALESRLVPDLLGVGGSFALAEVLTFGLAAGGLVFVLRTLSCALRSLSLLEVLFVAGSTVAILADHRNRMLNRPRGLSDWAWSLGVDPASVLLVVGILASVAAIFLFLRGQPTLKLVSTAVLLLLLGALFFVLKDKRIEMQTPVDPLGLSGKGSGSGSGSGSGGGGGASNDPFKDNYSSSQQPSPVAIAVLRDDFSTPAELLYFRQLALSSYNGHHLVAGTAQGWDADVITDYPRNASLRARHDQSAADHTLVPTTMYLLVDHPQPMALSHATKLSPAANPNPQQFVAAYDVESQTLAVSPQRLLGRRSIPESWSAAQRGHYLALPDDPRYAALADIIARDVDPRFAGDDLARAWAIKRYLEREGFYTMKSKHASSSDPTGSFLFGSLRGYCVHFAHAAVYLLRSQGIAARVALGYAVQTTKRSGGSSLLIMSDRAHAWPEIHLDGIGWVTFDVYPERTDVSPPTPVDYDLEKLLGELARNDKTAGVTPEGTPLRIPWRAIALGLALLALAALLGAYLTKLYRRLAPALARGEARARRTYRAVLDRLSDLGEPRLPGETRERHAERLQAICPHLAELTRLHLASALGGRSSEPAEVTRLVGAVRAELRTNVPALRRALGLLNPVGWLRTR